MVKAKAGILACALLALSLLIWTGVAFADGVQLHGKVTNQDSSPVAGCTVTLTDSATHAFVAATTTGSDGTYSLSVDPGTYAVKIECLGKKSPRSSGAEIAIDAFDIVGVLD